MSASSSSDAKEADLLIASLDMSKVTIEACEELDKGRTLCLEHSRLVLSLREWCNQVLENVEAGRRNAGRGKPNRAAGSISGVHHCLQLETVLSHWRSSIIQVLVGLSPSLFHNPLMELGL